MKNYDVVIPIIHGKNGEDGKLQGMMDLFNVKYVGSNLGASYICIDKLRTKQVLNNYDIPQVEYQVYEQGEKINIDFPVIIKPNSEGSSIGINLAKNQIELENAIDIASIYDDTILIEKYIIIN